MEFPFYKLWNNFTYKNAFQVEFLEIFLCVFHFFVFHFFSALPLGAGSATFDHPPHVRAQHVESCQ